MKLQMKDTKLTTSQYITAKKERILYHEKGGKRYEAS